ncbi:DUF1684 domain-containing protein [Gaetbulibacter saemankumensis]|uniref:DUF1684 domain-containing protein n=1 Tax=Gaetbulibacter saemankumensis TaxID=311208 RepID=UPI000422F5A7|nr:DUF1684 domain-containing protein [Gaetbulibacter saemankumensis]
MKKVFLIVTLLVVCCVSCDNGKQYLKGQTAFQKELNAEFKDATKSPLKEKDRTEFEGLDFFTFDSTYVVKAKLQRTPNSQSFKMKTTTDRLPEYVKYGILTFELKGETFNLNIYQNLGLMKKEGYEDYLFLPFLDETNGLESYGGGRYIDARIPDGHILIIDFNKAYNPYCAYNDKYSCPIVPRENYLKTRIEAGVKKFKDH